MSLRSLPSVDRLLGSDQLAATLAEYGRPLTLQAARQALDQARDQIRQGGDTPNEVELIKRLQSTLQAWLAPTLHPVINATGVIIHTNLGRAPLSQEAQAAMLEVARGYSTLEYDLASGKRGRRELHAEGLLRQLTGAPSALVVNNNASAVLLALTALAFGRQVLISRTQLVEIGGGFRIPDVLAQSGAELVEVGTTNRTHRRDFQNAINDHTALILRAHHSNFKIVGFTTEPSLDELVELGRQHKIAVIDDLGSGALLDTAEFGLGHEPTVQESLQSGASVVAFSGDKLLGGPQAGILLGEENVVQQLRQHPLARAVRPDKLCLAALSATLTHYLKDEALAKIPIWRMIAQPADELKSRAQAWADRLGKGEIIEGRSTVGGGSLPEESLPTWLLAFGSQDPDELAAQLRHAPMAVIARIQDDRVVLDPRTVLDEQEDELLNILSNALNRA
ncbi:MAG: L-seryl-tRNA(Sec) selenium transferase [Anaerolineales bacterium]|jgi:L-seryl-tRNA(Ser) seleniumtransferase